MSTVASVRAAVEHAVRQGKLSPQQLAAFRWLDEHLTTDQKQEFTELWRAEGSYAAAAPANPFTAVKPLLDLIAAGEGDYHSVNRGRAGDTPAGWPGLERLTIGAVQQLQADETLFAVGRYQFIPETLRMAVASAGFRSSDLFNPETQDWLAVALLLGGKRPALRDYLQGRDVTIEAAQLDLAREWASIPAADGRGVYDGDSAGNRATVKVAKVQSALRAARAGLAGRALPQLRLPTQQAPAPQAPQPAKDNPLRVPYFSQRDSAVEGQAQRMCFSSSCAMLVAFLRPGSITGPNADDQYLKRVMTFGDSTDAQAQIKALASYGIQARFVQNADWGDIERQINRGVPTPCGFLHHGPSNAPKGGGHWLTVIGYTAAAVIVNDPWGEMSVVAGEYLNSRGGGVAYSRKNWGPRWLVEGPRSGWAIIAEP
jgi:hypothetical protein